MKQTIAWIGDDNNQGYVLRKLAGHYRLLWVRREENKQTAAFHDIPGSEVEILNCAKEGSWEADIIVLAGEVLAGDLLGKIRDVATQKIVLVINWNHKDGRQQDKLAQIREALPFSKTLEVILHPDEMILSGENPEAVNTARRIVQLLGQDIRRKT